MTQFKAVVFGVVLLVALTCASAGASLIGYVNSNGMTLAMHMQGAGTTLSGTTPDYDWWYGCSPTSAGMLAGYYDINGYQGLAYRKLVRGTISETNTYGAGTYAVNDIIASSGHVADFYVAGVGASGDDVYAGRGFDSLADFMGTSQDSVSNTNGGTTFYFNPNGSKLYMNALTPGYRDKSGTYGIWEYFNYTGYNTDGPGQNFYNQYIEGYNNNVLGFSFEDYKNEIDNCRAVILHIEGHSMLGYGYDDATDELLFHDTWNAGEHRMAWDGAYSGRDLFGFTVVIPSGGDPVPLPAAIWLLGSGLLAVTGVRKRLRAA